VCSALPRPSFFFSFSPTSPCPILYGPEEKLLCHPAQTFAFRISLAKGSPLSVFPLRFFSRSFGVLFHTFALPLFSEFPILIVIVPRLLFYSVLISSFPLFFPLPLAECLAHRAFLPLEPPRKNSKFYFLDFSQTCSILPSSTFSTFSPNWTVTLSCKPSVFSWNGLPVHHLSPNPPPPSLFFFPTLSPSFLKLIAELSLVERRIFTVSSLLASIPTALHDCHSLLSPFPKSTLRNGFPLFPALTQKD